MKKYVWKKHFYAKTTLLNQYKLTNSARLHHKILKHIMVMKCTETKLNWQYCNSNMTALCYTILSYY